jgi:hypothetical protein
VRQRSRPNRDTILRQDSRCLGRDLNLLSPEYKFKSLSVDQAVRCCFTYLLSFLPSFLLFIFFLLMYSFIFLFSNISSFFHLPNIFLHIFLRILYKCFIFIYNSSFLLLSLLVHYCSHRYQPKQINVNIILYYFL